MTKIQFNSPKQKLTLPLMLLGTSLILSACGGGGTVVTPDPGNPTPTTVNVIAGTVKPWTQGETDIISPSSVPEISTMVKSNGDFDLPLPTILGSNDLADGKKLKDNCTGTVSVTDGLKYGLFVDLAVGTRSKTYYTYSSNEGGVFKYKGWWLATKEGTITAKDAECTFESGFIGKLTANVKLKEGWNIINYVQTGAGGKFFYDISNGTQTNDRMTWQPYIVSAQSLHSLSVQANPWGLLTP